MAKLAKPTGPHICLDCRTLLMGGGPCDGGKRHRVVDPNTAEGREHLLTQVWGPPDARHRARQAAKAGGSGAGAGALDSCAGCDLAGGGVEGLVAALVLAIVFVLLYLLISFIWRKVQAYRNRIKPRGAAAKAARAGRPTSRFGRVAAAGTSIRSAGSETPCVGYSLEVRSDRHTGSPVMLRHSECAPLRVVLDDGEEVEIPARRLRIEGASREHDLRGEELRRRLRLPEPDNEDLLAVPGDTVHEILLKEGDRVELLGELEREVDERNQHYRQQRFRWLPGQRAFGLRVVAD